MTLRLYSPPRRNAFLRPEHLAQIDPASMVRLSRKLGYLPVVLFPPWPGAEGHGVYHKTRFLTMTPQNPADYAERTIAFYSAVANDNRFHVAQVVEQWMQATKSGTRLYHRDGLHANRGGADVVAQVIWATLKPLLT